MVIFFIATRKYLEMQIKYKRFILVHGFRSPWWVVMASGAWGFPTSVSLIEKVPHRY